MNVITGHHMNQECMEAINCNNEYQTNDMMHDIMHDTNADIDDATNDANNDDINDGSDDCGMNVITGHHMNQECIEAINGNNEYQTNDMMHDIMHDTNADIDDATRAPTTTTSMTAVTTAV